MGDFKVFVRFPVGTPEEWGEVLATPSDQLPDLNENQRARARRWGISSEDERRNVLRQRRAEKRLTDEGARIGGVIERILEALDGGRSYHLRAIVIDGASDSWTLRVETPHGMKEFEIDIPSRSGASGQPDLKRELLSAIERADSLSVH